MDNKFILFFMDSIISDLLVSDYSEFLPFLLIFLGLGAAICLEGGLESLFYSIKGKRVGVARTRLGELKNFFIFLILFVVFEYVIYYLAESFLVPQIPVYDSAPFDYLPGGVELLSFAPPMFINPMEFMYIFTLLGTAIYAILQIPYSIYMYIKRDKVRGKRALYRLFVLVLIVGVLYSVIK